MMVNYGKFGRSQSRTAGHFSSLNRETMLKK
nr:MAG TPA: hypothetical protein [Caudoviricetes sp.]